VAALTAGGGSVTFLCGPRLEAGVGQHERGPGWPKPWALRCDGCGEEFEYATIGTVPGGDLHCCSRCQAAGVDVRALPPCEWCRRPIPALSRTGRRRREDSKTCGKRCRQASWRFGHRGARFTVSDRPLRLAYADPPYPGNAGLYREHPDYGGEVDHRDLVERLVADYPDGWALSTSAEALRWVWPLCPERSWVGAYVKPTPPREAHRPHRAWEAVIFYGGRQRPSGAPMVRDWVYATTLRGFPGRVIGMKPPDFCWWLFDCLNAQPHDELVDLFPGSGAVALAWERFCRTPAGTDTTEIGLAPLEATEAPEASPRAQRARTRRGSSSRDGSVVALPAHGQMDVFDVLGQELAS
jgi:hypothetical protein